MIDGRPIRHIRGGGPAFPVSEPQGYSLQNHEEGKVFFGEHPGMDLLDWFVSQAPACPLMQEIIPALKRNDPDFWEVPHWSDVHFQQLAFIEVRWRYAWAKEMLKQHNIELKNETNLMNQLAAFLRDIQSTGSEDNQKIAKELLGRLVYG